jgi:hypothetical protein
VQGKIKGEMVMVAQGKFVLFYFSPTISINKQISIAQEFSILL